MCHDNETQTRPSGVRKIMQRSGLLIASSGSAQDFFSAKEINNSINEFTPSAEESTFASWVYALNGLAFNSAGNLFVEDSECCCMKLQT